MAQAMHFLGLLLGVIVSCCFLEATEARASMFSRDPTKVVISKDALDILDSELIAQIEAGLDKKELKELKKMAVRKQMEKLLGADETPKEWNSQICSGKCGEDEHPLEVIGGSRVKHGEQPWIVKVKSKPVGGAPEWQCGGTILNSGNVLTAAHCVPNTTESVLVLAGRLGPQPEDGEQWIAAKRWIRHQDFEDLLGTFENDVAILHLADDLVMGETVAPVCLAPPADYTGWAVLVAGWGATDVNSEKKSDYLMKTYLKVTSNERCKSIFAPYSITITREQICASYLARGSCFGDSGGPLMVSEGEKWYQIGIVSAGMSCSTLNAWPSIYTFTPAHHQWIQHNVLGGYCSDASEL